MDALDHLVTCELLTGEEFVKKGLVGFRHGLADGLHQSFDSVARVGHGHLGGVALGVIGIGLHVDQVDIALHLALVHKGNDYRADAGAEAGFQALQHFIEIRVLRVQLGDEEDAGFSVFHRHFVGLLRPYRNTGTAGDGDKYAFRRHNALVKARLKVEHSGGVQQVDLGAAPVKGNDRRGYRHLALDFLRVKVADGVSVRHLAQAVYGVGFE